MKCMSVQRGVEEVGGGGQAAALTQGGSSYDVAVGTVVYVDVHRMVLLDLHTTGDETGNNSSSPPFAAYGLLVWIDDTKYKALPTTLGGLN